MNPTTDTLKQQLLERILDLPESHIREVIDFVDFLTPCEPGEENPLLRVAGCLSGNSLSAEDIEQELYGDGPA